ncbi:MAG: dTDP-glucose 4,6-dehydratase [Erysipelotrichaceae bacterium]|nr:dTDP-glucose 4,6-dehydratase [Erysipelotrichaceae bacterium]
MKYLVTGGAGFIGANYLIKMVEKYPHDEFICLDALTYAGNLETLKEIAIKPNYLFIRGDICDKTLVDELFKKHKFDYVINFAAETHVDRACVHPEIFIKTNVEGTQTLLEACRQYGIKRFHQVSTDEVYGDLPLEAKNEYFNEMSQIKPSSPYSASKAAADLLVLSYHRTFGLDVTISRCSNNYGPYQYPEKLIPLMIQKAINNEHLPVYGKGENIRDWLYVEDHCDAIDLIIKNGRSGEIYNVGGHNEKTNLEVVEIILEALKKPKTLINFVKDRPGHDLRYAIDPAKIVKLGWKPTHNFESGIQSTIKWNIEHQDWIKKVETCEYDEWMKNNYGSK